MTHLISHPELLACIAFGLKLLYAVISHLVRPYPRLRAIVEALTALMPDGLRFVEKALEAVYGLPMGPLDRRAPDPQMKALQDRLDAAERVIEAMREVGK